MGDSDDEQDSILKTTTPSNTHTLPYYRDELTYEKDKNTGYFLTHRSNPSDRFEWPNSGISQQADPDSTPTHIPTGFQNRATLQILSEKIQTLTTTSGMSSVKMEPFTGEDPTIAKLWLQKYIKYTTLYNYTNDQRIEALPLFLTLKALKWFNSQDFAGQDWDQVERQFLQRYAPTSIQQYNKLDILYNRKQRPTETFQDFLQEITYDAKSLQRYSEDFIKDCVIRNVRPAIKQFILQRPHQSLDEVIDSATLADNTIVPEIESNDKVMASIEELKKQLAVMSVNFERNASRNSQPQRKVNFQLPRSPPTRRRNDVSPRRDYQRSDYQGNQRNAYGPGRFSPRANRQFQRLPECFRCGEYHNPSFCYALKFECYNCGRIGHLSRMCLERRQNYQ